MPKQVPFYVTSGIPFGKTIVAVLPAGRDWWTSASQFEILAQVREAPDENSPLILDMAQYMTVTFAAPDTLTIGLRLSGAQTRFITKSGYYDIVMSDKFQVDGLAVVLLKGAVYRDSVVTADTEAIT